MKNLITWALLFICGSLSAQEVIYLWSNGAPTSNGITLNEYYKDGQVYAVSVPTLTVYPAKHPNGQAIIMCPGGGYRLLAMQHEGTDMADWFNNQGITYAVLKYRLPNLHKEVPLDDAQQAIRILRQRAAEWGIKKIGIAGASAGGHLAATAATHFTKETRPDFQIIFYGRIDLTGEGKTSSTCKNLLGENPSQRDLEYYSNQLQVTDDTPQAFIMASTDDKSVPVENSVGYYLALRNHHVPVTMHLYPTGGHGWGYHESFVYKQDWQQELEHWLREINL
ncbi:alpha/beta hydrolase [Phocaeicola oris]|uniref:alpha/beta hydrolase n=1 Tax=Phocaeicola oris TaxID=2896850 RepID=UPI00234F9875|nr:alpha/beta hydrolase [Phocaeicola oris]MCE2617488.1 alpha/beta hydrolase [Phocaeicola oris]